MVEGTEAAPAAGTRVSAVITEQTPRGYLSAAIGSAVAAGADEIVVVRAVPSPVLEWAGRFRDIPCVELPTGRKQALGVETATGDVVAFLDDDDLWEPTKVERIRARFAASPDLVYHDHAQTAIDASGRPAAATHPEFAGRSPERFSGMDRDAVWTLFDRIWPGNSSSTSVRRAWALTGTGALRETAWAADAFWLVAALLSDRGMELSPERLTRLRLHGENMSNPREVDAASFRRRHAEASARFAAAYSSLARLAADRRGPTAPLSRFLAQQAETFEFQQRLEVGANARSAAARYLRRGAGRHRAGLWGTALIALASPAAGRTLLYRAGRQRSRLG